MIVCNCSVNLGQSQRKFATDFLWSETLFIHDRYCTYCCACSGDNGSAAMEFGILSNQSIQCVYHCYIPLPPITLILQVL